MKEKFNEKVIPVILKFINTKGLQSIKNGMVTSICLSSIQIFLVKLNGAAENGTGARVRAMLARCFGSIGTKKRPYGIKPYERNRVYFAV